MPVVRTTITPGEVRSCSKTEFTDLQRQGLILEIVTETPAPASPAKAVGNTPVPTAKPSDLKSAKASDQ